MYPICACSPCIHFSQRWFFVVFFAYMVQSLSFLDSELLLPFYFMFVHLKVSEMLDIG